MYPVFLLNCLRTFDLHNEDHTSHSLCPSSLNLQIRQMVQCPPTNLNTHGSKQFLRLSKNSLRINSYHCMPLNFMQQQLSTWDFPGGSDNSVYVQCRRPGFYPWMGKSPGKGNGNPLQYSCLGNPMDRRAQQATVHGVAKSQIQLSN